MSKLSKDYLEKILKQSKIANEILEELVGDDPRLERKAVVELNQMELGVIGDSVIKARKKEIRKFRKIVIKEALLGSRWAQRKTIKTVDLADILAGTTLLEKVAKALNTPHDE